MTTRGFGSGSGATATGADAAQTEQRDGARSGDLTEHEVRGDVVVEGAGAGTVVVADGSGHIEVRTVTSLVTADHEATDPDLKVDDVALGAGGRVEEPADVAVEDVGVGGT